MDCQRIVMNFTVAPSLEDIDALVESLWQTLPEELLPYCEDVVVEIDDMIDETIQRDLGVEDPFEVLALYKSCKEISPGIEKKDINGEDVLVLYRRSLLDIWCESGEDLQALIRQAIIEELGRYFEFSEDDIQDMVDRHYQGLL